ncbi:MAG: extracellular solute-binding protein [Bacilli bacterium]|nr:extracellular solute-binding protein [Bacilli bacterium]
MKINKKLLLTLSSAACCGILTLTSCSLGGAPDPRRTDFRTVEFDENTSAKITFWHTLSQDKQELLASFIDGFKELYPNITITHTSQGDYDGLAEKVKKSFSAKTTPTMSFCYPDHVAAYGKPYVLQLDGYEGAMLSLEDESYESSFIEEFLNEGRKYGDGFTYSMPYAKSTEAMFYNSTFFEYKGYSVPTYWENPDDPNDLNSIIGLARAIKKEFPNKTPIGYDSDSNLFITLCKQYNVPYTKAVFDENGKLDKENSFIFNNQATKDLVKKLKGWYDEGLIITKGTLPAGKYTSSELVAGNLFMSIGSTGGTGYNNTNDFEGKVAPIPQQANFDASNYSKALILQGPSICFFTTPKITDVQLRAAWEFYKYITNTDNSALYSSVTGYEPVHQASYESEMYSPELTSALNVLVAGITSKPEIQEAYYTSDVFPGSDVARNAVGGIITDVFAGTYSIDTAFNKAFDLCMSSK